MHSAFENAAIRHAAARDFVCSNGTLTIGSESFELAAFRQCAIISIGKAGLPLFESVGALLPPSFPLRGVVSAPVPPYAPRPGVQYFQGGHPEPNQHSVQAAHAAIQLLDSCDQHTLVFYLISGGASSMFETPICAEIDLSALATLNRLLVGSGATIAEINCVRKHLSGVKGGRLAQFSQTSRSQTILVSAVPDGSWDAIGSGPTLPDPTTRSDFHRVVAKYNLADRFPSSIQRCIALGIDETPKPGHFDPTTAAMHVLLSNRDLLALAAHKAIGLGYTVWTDNISDDWECEAAADYLLGRAAELRQTVRKGCLLSGGEVLVRLSGAPGIGGRNQHFAANCALHNAVKQFGLTVLSVGSDGIDGNSPAAGAIINEFTEPQASSAGLDLRQHLQAFNTYPPLNSLGASINAGPTGNNLRDLRVFLWNSEHAR